MKQSNHISLFASILVGFFLVSSIVSDGLAALRNFCEFEGLTLTEKLTPACQWIDLTFEEREKEEENGFTPELQGNLFFIGLVGDDGWFAIAESSSHSFYHAPSVCGNATNMPLYLATGSLLI